MVDDLYRIMRAFCVGGVWAGMGGQLLLADVRLQGAAADTIASGVRIGGQVCLRSHKPILLRERKLRSDKRQTVARLALEICKHKRSKRQREGVLQWRGSGRQQQRGAPEVTRGGHVPR